MNIGGIGAYQQASRVTMQLVTPTITQGTAATGNQTVPGFGTIEDIVSLSPEAIAAMNGDRSATATAKTDEAERDEAVTVSDPFRAYRGPDGELSLEAVAQIEMLPPRLRDAGRLMREASSLRDEIAEAAKNPDTDPKALEALNAEYDATMAALWEELDKLGLTKKMAEGDISLEDLVSSGLNGLTALADEPGEGLPDHLGVAGIKPLKDESEA